MRNHLTNANFNIAPALTLSSNLAAVQASQRVAAVVAQAVLLARVNDGFSAYAPWSFNAAAAAAAVPPYQQYRFTGGSNSANDTGLLYAGDTQSYALYPHLSVAKNIDFPLRQLQLSSSERAERVTKTASMLGLDQLLDRKPRDLSGGQRQRVALARAIVREPKCFLMDEPLSNLDATLRAQTRADIVTLQQQLGTTTIYVTHDQVEAMTMGHRIAVMNQGVLQQVDTPSALYEQPANAFVAGFIGNPGMNLLPGTSKQGAVTVGNQPVAGAASSVEGAVLVGVRAEDLVLSSTGVQATCGAIEVLGSEVHVLADLDGGERVIIRQAADRPRPTLGEAITLELTASAPLLFDAATGQRCDR